MAGRKWRITFAIIVCASALGQAQADFVPGRVYVSGRTLEPCAWGPNERIYEFDPLTGESREFAVLPEQYCGGLTGLTFTPDGAALRASVWLPSTILEFDGNANVGVALGPGDGILGPLGSNNIAYDADGNFYVVNLGSRNIMRFPAGGGPGTIFANLSDGITGPGPIALAPNGDLYFAVAGRREIMRFSGPHQGTLFDTLPAEAIGVASLTVDGSNNLFVLGLEGIYRYEGGNPGSRQHLADVRASFQFASMTIAPDDSALYVAALNRVFSIDPDAGTVTELGFIDPTYVVAGSGVAVYIPEPSTLILLLIGLAAGVRRRSSHSPPPIRATCSLISLARRRIAAKSRSANHAGSNSALTNPTPAAPAFSTAWTFSSVTPLVG